MPNKWLSKSKYLNGLQCPKLLWIAVNSREEMPEVDETTQQIYDQGHLVGELAKKLFPEGIDILQDDVMQNIQLTKSYLQQDKPLFEAGILSGRLYSRVDILNPVGAGEWDILEVKSSTSVKDVNIDDVSFQKLVCEESGIRINRCFLVHLNNNYVRHGEIIPQELFNIEDISTEVSEREDGLRKRVATMLAVIDSPSCPETGIGPHCSNPYSCLYGECWNDMPEHNVFTLYRSGVKSYDLFNSGIVNIKDIPAGYKLNDKQKIQVNCIINGEVHYDAGQIKDFLSSITYPLYYFDFETVNPAVPLWNDSRPYQIIPFQYSLHIQATPGDEPEHHWFLAEGRDDPRPALLKQLSKEIGPIGTILAYNKSFEENVLKDMANVYPEYADWIENVNSRMVDLIVPFRGFYYYNPSQQGSASLKQVLPALTGISYEGMDIGEGGEASRRFLDATFGNISPEEEEKTHESLLKYCGQDTNGMVKIMIELRKLTS